ncbi:MAG TPA: calcium-binding protein [Chroococcales cyanobacterium]
MQFNLRHSVTVKWEPTAYVQISGNNIVISSLDGSLEGTRSSDVSLYNGSTTIQLSEPNNGSTQNFASGISGDNVVWYSYDERANTPVQIFLYNGSSNIQLNNNDRTYYDYPARISGNNVVWIAEDANNTAHLFLVTIPVWSATSTTLPSDIYDLVLTGTDNIDGIGNELSNSISGNNANNVLDGKLGDDYLYGKAGQDTLLGDLGSDSLIGGLGADAITGGAGADRFIRQYSNTGIDTITDFDVAEDLFCISASGFGGSLTSGTVIKRSQFRLGTAAADRSDRLIYDNDTGSLFFDADGTGLSDQIQIAQLTPGLEMSNANIFVFA